MRLSPVALYAPWPEGSRRTWALATPAVVLISYGLAIIPAIGPGALAAMSVAMQGGSAAEMQAGAMTPAVMLSTLLLQFAAWGGLIVWWTAQFERRGHGPRAAIGVEDRIARQRAGPILVLVGDRVGVGSRWSHRLLQSGPPLGFFLRHHNRYSGNVLQ
jgi:hypothetical protein